MNVHSASSQQRLGMGKDNNTARRPLVAIVGSGAGAEPAISHARDLGRLVAGEHWVILTGGRDAGVMKAANEGGDQIKGSLKIGILPDAESAIAPAVDVAIITGLEEARNNVIVLSADAVVACGVTDPGTASEVSLALKNGKPVIIIGAAAAALKFFGQIGNERLLFADTPLDAIRFLKENLL